MRHWRNNQKFSENGHRPAARLRRVSMSMHHQGDTHRHPTLRKKMHQKTLHKTSRVGALTAFISLGMRLPSYYKPASFVSTVLVSQTSTISPP